MKVAGWVMPTVALGLVFLGFLIQQPARAWDDRWQEDCRKQIDAGEPVYCGAGLTVRPTWVWVVYVTSLVIGIAMPLLIVIGVVRSERRTRQ